MKRDKYWDSLKFILIFFVVYGHVTSSYKGDSQFNMAIFNFIYMFHMPLFVFISGRFSHIRDKQKYKKGIIRLFETFIVFQCIRSIIPGIIGNKLSIGCITTPNWILWYLVALIYWRLLVYLIPKRWLKHPKRILLLSFTISIIAGFIPIGRPFAAQRALAFLPFFVMGYYSVDINVRKCIHRISPILSGCILIVTFLIFLYKINENLYFVHHCTSPYWTNDLTHTLIRFRARCVYIPMSIILCAMVMRLTPTNNMFAKWGNATLFVFIYHSFAVNILYNLIRKDILSQNEIMLFVYAVIITFGCLLLSHLRIFNFLLNPISYLMEKKK